MMNAIICVAAYLLAGPMAAVTVLIERAAWVGWFAMPVCLLVLVSVIVGWLFTREGK